MNSTKENKEFESLLTCAVCLEIYKEPKLLPCNHTFCSDCLHKIINNANQIKCPCCTTQFSIPSNGFPSDFRSNQLLDLYLNNKNNTSQRNSVFPSAPMREEEPMLNTSNNIDNNDNNNTNKILYRNNNLLPTAISIISVLLLIAGIIILGSIYINYQINCESSKYKNGTECIEKKHYLEKCDNSNQCNDKQSLLCLNGLCNCFPKQMYYDFEKLKCVYKKLDNQACRQTNECLSPMKCSLINKKCECNTNEYFDEANMDCLNKTLINSKCITDRTCHTDLGLQCDLHQRKCVCNSKTSFWSQKDNKCVSFYKYGTLGCSSNQQCDLNLICNLNQLNNNCSCPIVSQSGMCDCERNEQKQMYWNGLECVQAGVKWSKCKKNNYECVDSLVCLDRIGACYSNSKFLKYFLSSNHSNSVHTSYLDIIIIIFVILNIFLNI